MKRRFVRLSAWAPLMMWLRHYQWKMGSLGHQNLGCLSQTSQDGQPQGIPRRHWSFIYGGFIDVFSFIYIVGPISHVCGSAGYNLQITFAIGRSCSKGHEVTPCSRTCLFLPNLPRPWSPLSHMVEKLNIRHRWETLVFATGTGGKSTHHDTLESMINFKTSNR